MKKYSNPIIKINYIELQNIIATSGDAQGEIEDSAWGASPRLSDSLSDFDDL